MIFKNLSLLCDFYEFTMSNGYLENGLDEQISYFDVFFRKVPDDGGFVVASGLNSIINYIQNLKFSKSDISYLRKTKLFDENFLTYLANFKFQGDIYSVREGEIVFANEPLLTVRAKVSQAQLLETFISLSLNHQSLIATKANRIARAAQGRAVLEFGARRAQGIDAALSGARAAFIGGASASSCTLACKLYKIPVSGTMAHSWVQMFESEEEAFRKYCELYPQKAILLIDTYNVLQSGLVNAIKIFKEKRDGLKEFGVRIDSGNLCELSKKVRKILDDEGLKDCKIIASGALDEYEIQKLIKNGAKIDAFGVGERLITAKSSPVLGCVYKLVASEGKNGIKPAIKISENTEKINNPHFKKLFRIYDKKTKQALYDKLYLADEPIEKSNDLLYENLHIQVFKDGELVYKCPNTQQSKEYMLRQSAKFDREILALKKPKIYEVLLSEKLEKLKNSLLKTKGVL